MTPPRRRPIDDPGIDVPFPQEPAATFALLDPALPLALLPVRLETRFFLGGGTRELRVRVFPDAVHVDQHVPSLTDAEEALGRSYWRRVGRAGAADTAAADAAFAWVAGRSSPWRAAWIVRRTSPFAAHESPAPATPGAAPARLLPGQFGVAGYHDGESVGTWWGAPVPDDLPVVPGLAGTEDPAGSRAWLEAQGLAWTFDFEEAERVGMGIRIDLGAIHGPASRKGFDELFAFGVRLGDRREDVEALLTAQRYTAGLRRHPPGHPDEHDRRRSAGPRPGLAPARTAPRG